MRQKNSQSGLLPGKCGTFNDGEGVRLSKKATMLHVDTLNNELQIREQKLIQLKRKIEKSSIRVGFQTLFTAKMRGFP